jgi:predicted nucleotidyltransferase
MENEIKKQLCLLEEKENISILYAVESGSRAWGFASPDSDYDVRFIYVRPKDYYLKLEKTRDVIEVPINNILDINGWDLNKTLRLLHTSNPTLFEWSNSPIVYRNTPFYDKFKTTINDYFKAKSGLYHYLSTAKGNYREYLKGDMVKAKKYFYVLRPILACKWILSENCPPPMLFSQLVDSMLEDYMKPIVSNLLEIKMNSPEIKEIPMIKALNEYIDINIEELSIKISNMPSDRPKKWDELNHIFLSSVKD